MNNSIVRVGDTKLLWLLLVESGNGVGGQSPTLEIRRNRDWYYIDFDTNTFVDTGGRREEDMPEQVDTTGFYTFDFTPENYGETDRETYTIFYRNDSTEYGVLHAEEITFETYGNVTDDVYATMEFLRKILTNKTILRKLGIEHYKQFFYDDDNTTIIKTDDITLVNNDEIRDPE